MSDCRERKSVGQRKSHFETTEVSNLFGRVYSSSFLCSLMAGTRYHVVVGDITACKIICSRVGKYNKHSN